VNALRAGIQHRCKLCFKEPADLGFRESARTELADELVNLFLRRLQPPCRTLAKFEYTFVLQSRVRLDYGCGAHHELLG